MSLDDKKRLFVIMEIKIRHISSSIFNNLIIRGTVIGGRLVIDSGERGLNAFGAKESQVFDLNSKHICKLIINNYMLPI